MLNDTTKTETTLDPIAAISSLEAQIANLRKQVARGTRDEVRAPDLGARIEKILRARPLTSEELAREVGEPVEKVKARIQEIRKNLADIGTPDQARWVWRLGDEAPAKDLKAMVAVLIEGSARTTAELAKITGARMSRVNGVLVELQRNQDLPIFDISRNNFRAKWIIMPKDARPANLPPKGAKPKT